MKAYLIPGNGEDLKSRDYQAVLNTYKSLGYQPKFVPIKWRYHTLDGWIKQAQSQISAKDLENSLLSGFSFGSMIAFGLAAKTNPKKLLLFSLSPYFKEDLPFPAKYLKWHGTKRLSNFRSFSMNELAKKIDCPTTLFVGSMELERYPDTTGRRVKAAHKAIKDSQLIIVKDTAHDVADPNYLKAIKKSLA